MMTNSKIGLNVEKYLNEFSAYPSHKGITGGTIHDFLKNSTIEYYGGKCAVYYVTHYHNGSRAVIGGRYATNGKPKLVPCEQLDF